MKKQILLSIIFSTLLTCEIQGQITFQKMVGRIADDYGYSVQQTADGAMFTEHKYSVKKFSTPQTQKSILKIFQQEFIL